MCLKASNSFTQPRARCEGCYDFVTEDDLHRSGYDAGVDVEGRAGRFASLPRQIHSYSTAGPRALHRTRRPLVRQGWQQSNDERS
jgi:hypothetical protein